MKPNAETQLVKLIAKRRLWSRNSAELRPGDRTAVRPVRQDFAIDRWLIVSIPIGGNHFGIGTLRQQALDWEESVFPWLDEHPTAMWDGHELGCGELRLLILTPNPTDLLSEIQPKLPPMPGSFRFFTRIGAEGAEMPVPTV